MLTVKVYRAPATEPGQTTLLADTETWETVLAAMRVQRNQTSIDVATRVARLMAAAGDGPVVRLLMSTADAQAVLRTAATAE